MKASSYNFIFENKKYNNWLLYNSFRNSMVEIDSSVKRYLDNMSNSGKNLLAEDFGISDEEKRILHESGCLVDDDFNELEEAIRLDEASYKHIKNHDSLNLTICPTFGCNLKCFYCYERHDQRMKKQNPMKAGVQEQIVSLYACHCKQSFSRMQKIRKTDSIHWYGGEPLLYPDIIDHIQSRLNSLAGAYNRSIKSTIITNGILLNTYNQEILKRNKIKYIQVTIDGPEAIHNKRRYFPDAPEKCFQIIMQNLLEIDDYFNISIRINIDTQNYQYLAELLEYFDRNRIWPYRKKIGIYISNVNTVWNNDKKYAFDLREFERIKRDFKIRQVDKFNSVSKDRQAKLQLDYPSLQKKNHACRITINKNSYVIGPGGEIYTCFRFVENEKYCIGTIDDLLSDEQHSERQEFRLLPQHRKEIGCHSCKIFPICSISCPEVFLQSGDIHRERLCSKWKYILRDTLLFNYDFQRKYPDIAKVNSENEELYHQPQH